MENREFRCRRRHRGYGRPVEAQLRQDTLSGGIIVSAVIMGNLTLSAVLVIRVTNDSRTAVLSLNQPVRQKARKSHTRASLTSGRFCPFHQDLC